ncbi:MAG: bifunctional 5,10-methylenetetrahydrofolate dehydrogenase/5,10-methenyltetrahydrofolate cyclohydrolase [Chloroflexota bacterium]|nr:bifunctional 5,10-methylenetetrahydrofolate dehydrogenase/5,10-methenyltetrahydrofolate cyclohydrolase [Chloroflexota bacterium]
MATRSPPFVSAGQTGMMARLLRGAPLARRLRAETAAATALLRERGRVDPVLATLLVGRDAAALAYRRSIERALVAVGVGHRALDLAAETSQEQLVAQLRSLNDDRSVHGVLVLMPLPRHLPASLILEHLSPLKDVDGITPTNAGRLHLGLPSLRPSTPQGCIEILDHYAIPIAGQHVVVIGRSNVVGRPLATMLSLRDATVTLCHRQTEDLATFTRAADIVAVAAGHPGLVRGDMLRPGSVVVDFGINVVADGIVGDADAATVREVAGAYTPVPGGTGPVTSIVLARNTVAAAFASLAGSLDEVEQIVPLSLDKGI